MAVQRGAIVAQNDCGTLERVDGTNTLIGTATLTSGKVLTKRFRASLSDEPEAVRRWLKWQCRKDEDGEPVQIEEVSMADDNKLGKCPFTMQECKYTCPIYNAHHGRCAIDMAGSATNYMASQLLNLKLDEEVEMVALAIGELTAKVAELCDKLDGRAIEKAEPEPEPALEVKALTAADGVDAYFEGKSFLSFVNLHSKTVYQPYKRFCEDKGFPVVKEAEFSKEVKKRCPELKPVGKSGGYIFTAA